MTNRPNAADHMAQRFDSEEEIIVWHRVSYELPDDETTVLLFCPDFEEVEKGYRGPDYDGNPAWIALLDGCPYSDDVNITHWAHVPLGPIVETPDA